MVTYLDKVPLYRRSDDSGSIPWATTLSETPVYIYIYVVGGNRLVQAFGVWGCEFYGWGFRTSRSLATRRNQLGLGFGI